MCCSVPCSPDPVCCGGPGGACGASLLAGMPRFPFFGNQRAKVGLWSHPDTQSGHSWDILKGLTV